MFLQVKKDPNFFLRLRQADLYLFNLRLQAGDNWHLVEDDTFAFCENVELLFQPGSLHGDLLEKRSSLLVIFVELGGGPVPLFQFGSDFLPVFVGCLDRLGALDQV